MRVVLCKTVILFIYYLPLLEHFLCLSVCAGHLFQNRERSVYNRLRVGMMELINLHKQLVSGTLTQEQMAQLKEQAALNIDQGNK